MTPTLRAAGGCALLALLPAACAEPPRAPDTVRIVRVAARPAAPPVRTAARIGASVEPPPTAPAPVVDEVADAAEEASQTAARRADLYRLAGAIAVDEAG